MPGTPSVILWKEIHEISDKVCKNYGLKYNAILPETRKLVRYYGECLPTPKGMNINIRIHQLKNPNKPLAKSTILRTLAHELAHLKYWDHGSDHTAFSKEILNYIREELNYTV